MQKVNATEWRACRGIFKDLKRSNGDHLCPSTCHSQGPPSRIYRVDEDRTKGLINEKYLSSIVAPIRSFKWYTIVKLFQVLSALHQGSIAPIKHLIRQWYSIKFKDQNWHNQQNTDSKTFQYTILLFGLKFYVVYVTHNLLDYFFGNNHWVALPGAGEPLCTCVCQNGPPINLYNPSPFSFI